MLDTDTPLRGATYTTYQPYYEARDGAAHRKDKRTALPPPEGMCEENDMGQGNLATRPLDPQMGGALPFDEGRAPTVADLGPHSPDSISSSLMPYGMGEDNWSGEDQEQQDQTLDQEEAEEEGNLPVEEATSKLRMGLHVGPAMYQPASPKYIRNFSFTPGQDDIEAYRRDVKEAAHQLNYNDEAILHLIKATMPSEIYGTLYNQHDLNTVITMVKDIYAKKPEMANPPQASGGATAPFTLIKAPNGANKRIHFQGDEPLSDRIDKLTEVLFRMDMDGKPNKKPYKPYITSPRRRGRGRSFRPRGGRSGSDRGEGWPRFKGKFRGARGGFPRRGRFQGRKFDKSPTTKRPRVSGKAEDKDKDRCYHCHQRGHFAAECPEKSKGQAPKPPEGKKFEDYTYAYSGAEGTSVGYGHGLTTGLRGCLDCHETVIEESGPLA